MGKYLAKSNGFGLEEHLIETANKCKEYAEGLTADKELIAYSYLTGLFHDYGKCTQAFQDYLSGGAKERVEHTVTSALFVKYFINGLKVNETTNFKEAIVRSVLFHHPLQKKNYKDNITPNSMLSEEEINFGKHLIDIYNKNIGEKLGYEISFNGEFAETYINEDIDNITFNSDFFYKDESTLGKVNSLIFFFTLVLRQADVLSSNHNLNINDFTKNKSFDKISIQKPEGYDERFDDQLNFAKQLIEKDTVVFKAQTGYGKTMLGLLYLLQNNKKGYWICPRNTIAHGVYETLVKEANALKLNISIALLLTGSYKECFNGDINEFESGINVPDIVVTNIDNFFRPLIKTGANYRTFTMLNSNCIFDEFHEYVTKEPIFAAYWSIMKCRVERCNNAKTLLLSATPEKLLYEPFIRHDNTCVFEGKSKKLLNKQYKIVFGEPCEPDLKGQDILVYHHSVRCVQNDIERELCDNGIHALYTETDKGEHLKDIISTHGKNSNNFNVSWVGNSVIGVGLDISFNHVWINNPTPRAFLQTCGGRTNRWCEKQDVSVIYITNNQNKSEDGVIQQMYTKRLAARFYNYMRNSLQDGEIINSEKMIKLVEQFENLEENLREYKDLVKSFKQTSFITLTKIEYSYTTKTPEETTEKHISDKPSLRSVDKKNIFIIINESEMTEPMQVEIGNREDGALVTINDLRDMVPDTVRIIKNDERYFKTKYQRKNVDNKGNSYLYDYLINLAKCSETPFVITNNFGYTKESGLFRL